MSAASSILKMTRRGGLFLALLVVAAHTDVAVAYWQSGGTRVAAPSERRTATKLRVNQTADLHAVGPGGPAQTLSGDFDNRNADPVHVAAVTVSIASVTKARDAVAGECDASDFTLAHRVMTVAADVPSGRDTGAWHGATIAFRDKPGVDQNACMGATVKLRYATS